LAQLRFQNGADLVQILRPIGAGKPLKKALGERLQPPDDVSGKRCGPRDQGDAVDDESRPLYPL
jgi:hypothetical protein